MEMSRRQRWRKNIIESQQYNRIAHLFLAVNFPQLFTIYFLFFLVPSSPLYRRSSLLLDLEDSSTNKNIIKKMLFSLKRVFMLCFAALEIFSVLAIEVREREMRNENIQMIFFHHHFTISLRWMHSEWGWIMRLSESRGKWVEIEIFVF